MSHSASSVLVVDDDPLLLALARELEPGSDLVIHTCASTAEADRLVAHVQVDVALVDHHLGSGEPTGLAWLIGHRRRDQECFRIISTASTDFGLAVDLINQDTVDAFLPKPWTPEQLLALLHQGCEAALIRRHNRSLVHELGTRNAELLELASRLETLVDERTAHLSEANEKLRTAHAELARSQGERIRLETLGAVAQLVRGLAHELNNPLATILGYAQRLQVIHKADEDTKRRLGVILAEVDRCSSLVSQLHGLAQPPDEDTEAIAPGDLLARAQARLIQQGAACPDVRIDPRLPTAQGGPRAFQQVCEQVLANAAAAGARTCRLSGRREQDRVRLVIANDGATPDADQIRNALRPFYTTMSAEGHRGLGLALCYGLLREQDGTIELAARSDGPGAEVVITLPAATSAPAPIPAARSAPDEVHRVLVIDDEPLVAGLLVDALADFGLQADVVSDAAAALALVAQGGHSAAIVDVHLGSASGIDLARRLIETWPALEGHLALVTGDGDVEAISRASGLPVIGKPFRMDHIERLAMSFL